MKRLTRNVITIYHLLRLGRIGAAQSVTLRRRVPIRESRMIPAREPEREIHKEQDDVDYVGGQEGGLGQGVAVTHSEVDQGAKGLDLGGQREDEGDGGLVAVDPGLSPFPSLDGSFELHGILLVGPVLSVRCRVYQVFVCLDKQLKMWKIVLGPL